MSSLTEIKIDEGFEGTDDVEIASGVDRDRPSVLEGTAGEGFRPDGRPIDRVKVTSPFNPRLRYNLYACLTILPRHQERHLWQAERVLERLQDGK